MRGRGVIARKNIFLFISVFIYIFRYGFIRKVCLSVCVRVYCSFIINVLGLPELPAIDFHPCLVHTHTHTHLHTNQYIKYMHVYVGILLLLSLITHACDISSALYVFESVYESCWVRALIAYMCAGNLLINIISNF